MRALVQRVSEAAVRVDGEVLGEIGPGLLVLVCAMQGDSEAQADALAAKIAKLRIFKDEAGKMNRALQGHRRRGAGGEPVHPRRRHLARQPAGLFHRRRAGRGRAALRVLRRRGCAAEGIEVAQGRFGADMKVSLVNDGPVTIWIEI